MDAFFVWLTTWFRKLTGQASKEPEAAVVEEPATAKEPAIAKADVNGEPLKKPPLASSSTWMQFFEQNAEYWEMHPEEYVVALDTYGRTGAANAILDLNWEAILVTYSQKVLDNVFFAGTDLELEGFPETGECITEAVRGERARRRADLNIRAPAQNGMNASGTQGQ